MFGMEKWRAVAPLALGLLAGCGSEPDAMRSWSEREAELISSLSLTDLPEPPADPSNRVADSREAAVLGEALFFDARLSGNGQVACSSCHLPDRQFQDDIPLARGMGTTDRRTMPIAGTAFSPFLFWDGRKDSQWSQALGPLESVVEHGTNRTAVARLIGDHYRDPYESLFGPMPELEGLPASASPATTQAELAAWKSLSSGQQHRINEIFSNVGKSIAAYERTLMPSPGRFDAYADAVARGDHDAAQQYLTEQEQDGLDLFINTAGCINCHNGPLLTDHHFHNTGVAPADGLPDDLGRLSGAAAVQDDPFNCLGVYSDAEPEQCQELMFMVTEGEDLVRAFKTPSLRGASLRPPYMHAGQIETLADVIAHYNAAPPSPAGHTELTPLALSAESVAALEAFLRAIDDPLINGTEQ